MIKKFLAEYKKTLKPIKTEELFDLYIVRPISFLLVLLVKNINFSPNYYTFMSMITGIITGYLFASGNYEGLIFGVLFLQITNIFDCADGQLSRYKKISSKFGKTLDGLADIVTYFAISFGIAYHIYSLNGEMNIFLYSFISLISMCIHIMYFDQFKNEFISYSIDNYVEKSDSLEVLKQNYLKLKKKNNIKWILSFLYYIYYYIEVSIVNFGYIKGYKGYYSVYKNKSQFNKIKKRYYNNMGFSVRLWSFFGASSHLVIFSVFALIDNPVWIFHYITIVYNILMILLVFYQKICFKKLLKSL